MQRTDRKKADNRDRKIHESEHRNKNSKVTTSREEKNFKTAKKSKQLRETERKLQK